MNNKYAVLDFETTGLSPNMGARVTEVAVVILHNGQVIDRYQSLINAGVRIPTEITQITGITNAMVKSAPPVAQVMREVHARTSDAVFVAHNASFDMKFLQFEGSRLGLQFPSSACCTLLLARRLYPHMPNHKLATLAAELNISSGGAYHRALVDTEVTANLFMRIIEDLRHRAAGKVITTALLQRLQKAKAADINTLLQRHC
ncbi:3'-5' exonuclease [Chitinibacter bivalviorum]|uniref:DNA-directed DNA polymerase n=1 Tax=Chitinibacter bivalviorum TaxID=2739434 RepID=A0A7H9BNH1_9NEIS|nr:3'-5' exonuclease [Chitinibacter bivalviorum]QLG89581.1 3'-5' exonuclease [Chitinibacter bivalviorum]